MKVEVNREDAGFKPIEVKITIKSMEELKKVA